MVGFYVIMSFILWDKDFRTWTNSGLILYCLACIYQVHISTQQICKALRVYKNEKLINKVRKELDNEQTKMAE